MRERLAFLHLPKSAGVSCRHAFEQYYSRDETVPFEFGRMLFGSHDDFESIDKAIMLDDGLDLSAYRYMEGHFPLPTITAAFSPDDVVCILREPRARLLSHFTYWRTWDEKDHASWEPYNVAALAQLPLVEFLSDAAAAHQIDNLMTRLIIGEHPLIPVDDMIAEGDRAELADLGACRLEELGFVDILERGQTMFAALEAWFGSPLEEVQLNTTNLDKGPPLTVDDVSDPRVQSLLNDRTAIDLMLWKRAATMTGMSSEVADVLARRTGVGSLTKLVERTKQRAAAEAAAVVEAAAEAAAVEAAAVEAAAVKADRLPAPQRLIALFRRGPKAIGQRVQAEIQHRRHQRDAR